MRIIETINDLKAIVRTRKKEGKSIGLVPTMGYLHEGHTSLIKASKHDNDFTVLSIYVNPTQFGVNEDFSKYPRDMDRDSKIAEEAGVDVIFAPSDKEMYPEDYKSYVTVEGITEKLCGKSRPGHFKGVTTVVAKLFNIVEPDNAYFGQKDAQQVIVVKKMVKDLNMNLKIVICPIIREQDGLAMSSRNVYLGKEERKAALVLSRSLVEVEGIIKDGERSGEKVIEYLKSRIMSEKIANVDYISVVDAESLEEVNTIKKKTLIALAVKFGNTRLIDNVIVEV
ncbi:MAG: pantoate--beta-alanine ligase [Clostridia bacterium]|nr:pantoate--beta-alanine ligase [Clostridia bacterium]